MKALLSTSNKEGLDLLCKNLVPLGYELYATSGTMIFLKGKGIPVHPLEEITGFKELASGRVKTLNERIFEMILSQEGEGFDLLVVNLYPFESAISYGEEAMIENFDIGGVALLRAGAKNFYRVSLLSSPEQYTWFLKNHPLDLEKKRFLAQKAMETVVRYDSLILKALFSCPFYLTTEKVKELPYGENPHQRAWVGRAVGVPSALDHLKQVKGDLSFNNYLDLLTAIRLVQDCGENAMAIIKHTNPCGVSQFREDLKTTFQRTLSGDPQSAYGGVLCVNGEIDEKLAKVIKPHFFDVIVSRHFAPQAEAIFQAKKASLVEFSPFPSSLEWRVSDGLVLIQEPDTGFPYARLEPVTSRKPTEQELKDADFGLRVVRYVKSNAVVLVKEGMLIGLGAGQPSRVYSAQLAVERAGSFAHSTEGSVMVSDGFFPFKDSIEIGLKAGVRCFVEPGGSKRDAECMDLCEQNRATLIFTGKRLFKH
ncbi:MAG: bifunctional phosphoribosylaminoimidazolecarboxamide formyltransferase/IMP cyclohydrolase [Coprothermobacterota bacterium]|nr:bifunctional phosphoribosylaminoimidazolecarboxamide formyltransferase/IMP cyclohydrolase [Coprothermobacterota bacterium]